MHLEIEELKRAEQALRESELKLREIIETVPGLLWSNDPDGEPNHVNQRMLDYGGMPSQEVLRRSWETFVHPADYQESIEAFYYAIQTGTSFQGVARLRRADGEFRWHHSRCEPLYDREGRIVQWYGLSVDIDDGKRAENELRESEHKLRRIVETVPSMLWSTAPDGEPTRINQRILDYSGLSLENFLNLGWKEFLHPEDFPETARAFFHAIQTGEPYEAVHRLRRADGQYRWHHARGEPLRDRDGKIVQWYGLSVDIDEGKRAENELRSTQAKLARASQGATVAELSASIAHEINQPLAGIVASAEACRTWLSGDKPNVERATAAIERIIRDGGAAADIIQRIRALFKQTALAMSLLQINEVIDEVRRLIQDELNRKGISPEFDLAPALPRVLADRIQIQQVLVNLIRNGSEALENVDDQAKRLIVRSRSTNASIVVEVCDYGSGLADPEKAFDPFYSTKQNGLGVGLAISRSIIQAHGGEISARDNKPQGTVLSFTLPARSEAGHASRN